MKEKSPKMLCLDDMVNIIAADCNISKTVVKDVIISFRDATTRAIQQGHSVYIVNGWTFDSVKTKEKKLKNPKTQEIIMIPEGSKPRAKFSSKIKEAAKRASGDRRAGAGAAAGAAAAA